MWYTTSRHNYFQNYFQTWKPRAFRSFSALSITRNRRRILQQPGQARSESVKKRNCRAAVMARVESRGIERARFVNRGRTKKDREQKGRWSSGTHAFTWNHAALFSPAVRGELGKRAAIVASLKKKKKKEKIENKASWIYAIPAVFHYSTAGENSWQTSSMIRGHRHRRRLNFPSLSTGAELDRSRSPV